VSIIHLKKTELFTTVIPSKLFECMGMGIPVLHGVAGESAGIVEKEAVGLVFEPENADELIEKLVQLKEADSLYRQFRQNCLSAARRYDRAELARKMLTVLKGVGEPRDVSGALKGL
jgi:glycosyltransferase involved in cell wall biosynthesis